MAKYTKGLFGMYGGQERDVIIEGENIFIWWNHLLRNAKRLLKM